MTLDEHFSAQPGATVVPSHMVESLLYMETGSQKEEKLLLTELLLPSGTGQFPESWKVWLTRKLNQHLLPAAWAAQCVQIRLAVLQRVKEKLWIQMELKCKPFDHIKHHKAFTFTEVRVQVSKKFCSPREQNSYCLSQGREEMNSTFHITTLCTGFRILCETHLDSQKILLGPAFSVSVRFLECAWYYH